MPTQTVLKWGNSLAVRIPAPFARELQVVEGSEIELRLEGRMLVIERNRQSLEFTHQALAKALRKRKKNGRRPTAARSAEQP